jgi:hypothetical protein
LGADSTLRADGPGFPVLHEQTPHRIVVARIGRALPDPADEKASPAGVLQGDPDGSGVTH